MAKKDSRIQCFCNPPSPLKCCSGSAPEILHEFIRGGILRYYGVRYESVASHLSCFNFHFITCGFSSLGGEASEKLLRRERKSVINSQSPTQINKLNGSNTFEEFLRRHPPSVKYKNLMYLENCHSNFNNKNSQESVHQTGPGSLETSNDISHLRFVTKGVKCAV